MSTAVLICALWVKIPKIYILISNRKYFRNMSLDLNIMFYNLTLTLCKLDFQYMCFFVIAKFWYMGSYMSVHKLFNLLNKLRKKKDKRTGLFFVKSEYDWEIPQSQTAVGPKVQ